MNRQVILYEGEDGQWVAEIPSLPGCVSQGPSRNEALRNIAEAAALWIETADQLGMKIPVDPGTAEVADLRVA